MGILANRENPDEMPQNTAFHQGLNCLLRHIRSSTKEIQYFLEIKTSDPSIYTNQSQQKYGTGLGSNLQSLDLQSDSLPAAL